MEQTTVKAVDNVAEELIPEKVLKRNGDSRVELGSPSERFDLADWAGVPSGQEDRIWISELMATLSSRDQKILKLFVAGYTHEEIAQLLGFATATSRSRVFRARLKIQRSCPLIRQRSRAAGTICLSERWLSLAASVVRSAGD